MLAALALGRVITDTWPGSQADDRPFVRQAAIGHTLHLGWLDATVTNVEAAPQLATGNGRVSTNGVWVVVDLRLVPRHVPLKTVYVSITDAAGHTYSYDIERYGAVLGTTQTGVPCRARYPIEMPKDALTGAVLHLATNHLDTRRETVGRVDLGITAAKAAQMRKARGTIAVDACDTRPQPTFSSQPGTGS